MKLYNLLVLLSANIEHITKILIQRQQIFINNLVYEMRLYGSIPKRVEIQFSKQYGKNENDYDFNKIKEYDIEIILDNQAKHEIILNIFNDENVDKITI